MAAASVSMPGAPGLSLGFDDYSLYSNLSDDDLMQLAIERSLSDAHTAGSTLELNITPMVQNRTNPPARPLNPALQPNPPMAPQLCSHNPPANVLNSRNALDGDVSHFITGNGKRMVGYRRYDGTLQVAPEPEEELQPIIKAIYDGDAAAVREIVKQPGNSWLVASKHGWLPLHEAAYFGQTQCLRILLVAQPGMLNKRTLKDQTALILAVGRDHVDCVEALLERGADTEVMNQNRETALYKACERENAAIVATLLNHGATVNKQCIQGWTALHEAVSHHSVEICEMLVKAGAKLSATNIYGISPVFTAAQSGRVETLGFLLKNGADVNSQAADGATALYEAAKNSHEDVVELLISRGADANRPGKTGLLPLHIAAQRGTDGKSILTYDCLNYDKSFNIVSMLIPSTSKARVRRTGISPLHLAAERNRDETLEALIEAGFDVNAELSLERSKMFEDRRTTVLYFAVINNNIEAATMLLEAGANPNLDTFNPLLVAVRQGCIRTVTLLVDYGANVNAYIPTIPTSFPAAIMFCMKYLSMLKYLMDNGCDALSCFDCVYGNDQHPPIKTLRSERDDLRHRTGTSAPITCLQFCEMISTPAVCRWAGPIIDVLLDYVGHVKLCSRLLEHLDSYPDWQVIKEKAVPPRSLMQLCRVSIRQQLGVNRLKLIHTLPLPGRLVKYMNHEERTQDFALE
ncbi:ankyrin repeat and SOCS box protein 2-like isoform X1 [Hypomesus transpacificus]|uniref:ankyrin repeat and SOCS box protein 2-like isoform X1 n=2 Tax=Hypomesus transpacificus TaxID=137520 RepID=UPI001F0863C3|nr:ankyrin repeat and SOCS box protein 2-like isoform X1 [Hypomesus transpacificus]XP_046877798.1 ankyrin repeat and SOCS box protein 2-like isoform X1 [Hypomesus transpacificus]